MTVLLLSGSLAYAQDDEVGSGGIGGRPAYPREGNERSESIFIHTIDPSGSVEDGIRVVNNTNEERTIQVYATDSVVSSDGAFACAQFVEERTDVGAWVALEQEEVTLQGSSTEVVDFTITVPEATDVGEHDGCIVVQEKKPLSDNEQGIGLSFRTALRLAILVPGDIEKKLEITDFNYQLKSDEIILSPQITNSGNVSIDADIQTRVSHFFGLGSSTAGGPYPVLRGETGTWNFKHDRPFWGGLMKAEVTADYDTSTDGFLGDGSGETETLTFASLWIVVFPHPLAFAIELLVVLLVSYGLLKLLGLRKFKRTVKKDWHTHTVKSGEDIKSIAKANDISWKKLARANKLKAPYTLSAGDKLRVPKASSRPKPKKDKPKKIDVIG